MLAKSRTLKWYVLIMIPLIFVVGGSIASFVIGSIMGKKKKKKKKKAKINSKLLLI
jgi:NADH:ubiquinone oxidoreductase subunit 3 (subunit A)